MVKDVNNNRLFEGDLPLGTPHPDCGVCCTQDKDGDLIKMALKVQFLKTSIEEGFFVYQMRLMCSSTFLCMV